MAHAGVARDDITGLILAGGRGLRMGGVDKGLQDFRGEPLVCHAMRRLSPQVARVAINANRHPDDYAALGARVWADAVPDFAGPLAGFLAGLSHGDSPYLLTVPCDSPCFPLDLAARLGEALVREHADIAMAWAPEADDAGQTALRAQPVFCLLKASLRQSLSDFIAQGGRKIDRWTAQHRCVPVAFDTPADDPRAFLNLNTLQDLQQLDPLLP